MKGNRDLYEKVEELKQILVRCSWGTGGQLDSVRFRELRKELIQDPSVSELLPSWLRDHRDLGEFDLFMENRGPSAAREKFLKAAFQQALDTLEGLEPLGGQRFFPAGSDHDAFTEIRSVVKTAQAEILVVDPWVDETLWVLLKNLPSSSNMRVLTEKMKGDFLVEAKKFAKQHEVSIQIRQTPAFHDRFIVIDGARCWHLGASIKDAGAKAFLLSEIQGSAVKQATITSIEAEWRNAVPVPL